MRTLPWTEQPDHTETLAVALRAVLAAAGRQHEYERLVAALGLGTLVTAAAEESPAAWPWLGRERHLPAAAELLGVRLRELHPPLAARGLRRSAEFPAHFRDSYLPLIRRAIEHEQLVLAWRGWPPPREDFWGVITEVRDDMVVGFTCLHKGEPMPLIGAAHLAYVIEELGPAVDPLDDRVTQQALAAAVAEWRDAQSAGIACGRAAYDLWVAALEHPPAGVPTRAAALTHAAFARVLCNARAALVGWLRSPAVCESRSSSVAARWAAACDEYLHLLRPLADAAAVQRELETHSGRERAADAIRNAREHDALTVQMLLESSERSEGD